MNTAEIVAKLTAESMANSYLMTYMAASREELGKRGLELTPAIAQEDFFLTQVSVSSALGQMETPKAIAILQSLAQQTPDGRVRRMAEESIKKVQSKIKADDQMKDLQESVDKLQQENQALQSRLAKLETLITQDQEKQ